MKMIKKTLKGKDFESLKEDFKNAIETEGFSILAEYDFKKILTSKGKKCDSNVYVVDICNPSNAEKILLLDTSIGIYLPCKMGIFEENGAYKVVYVQPTSFIESASSEMLEILKDVGDALERISMALSSS
ncbi:DUF302 domain-containing protein [Mesoaciditoga lauensis]|uniref:DUF302 domain-containing protein n=1 Tax=Mesoaciditoga lauensis TaxID=1495039 RepID=UPI00055ED818|nr:DUF302 domain-containing protein [Mesoaciditoga lauensis]